MVLPLPLCLPSYLRAIFCCQEVSSEELIQCCRVGIGLQLNSWTHKMNQKVNPLLPLPLHWYSHASSKHHSHHSPQHIALFYTHTVGRRCTVGIVTWTALYRTYTVNEQTWLTMWQQGRNSQWWHKHKLPSQLACHTPQTLPLSTAHISNTAIVQTHRFTYNDL